MRNHILNLIFAMALSLPLSGETMFFREFNFSMEFPSSWHAVNPPPDQALSLIKTTDGSKGFVIVACKFPEDKLANALDQMVKGARESATKLGIKIENEKTVSIAGVSFRVHTMNMPNGVSIVSYFGLADNIGFSFQGFCKSDAGSDAEISAIVNSFKLIDESGMNTSKNQSDTTAYKLGRTVGGIAFVSWIIGAIIILNRKTNQKKNG